MGPICSKPGDAQDVVPNTMNIKRTTKDQGMPISEIETKIDAPVAKHEESAVKSAHVENHRWISLGKNLDVEDAIKLIKHWCEKMSHTVYGTYNYVEHE